MNRKIKKQILKDILYSLENDFDSWERVKGTWKFEFKKQSGKKWSDPTLWIYGDNLMFIRLDSEEIVHCKYPINPFGILRKIYRIVRPNVGNNKHEKEVKLLKSCKEILKNDKLEKLEAIEKL